MMTRRFRARAAVACALLAACLMFTHASATADGALSLLAVIDVGFSPVSLAVSQGTQRLFVAGGDSGNLGVVSTASLSVSEVWQIDGGVQWSQPSSDDKYLYVARGLRAGPHEFQVISAQDGSLVRSLSTNLRLSRPIVDAETDRVLMTGNQAEAARGGIGVPPLLVMSQSTQSLIENRFIGINGSMSVGELVSDRCRQLLYMFQSVRGYSFSTQVRDARSLEQVFERPALHGTSYQGTLTSIATGLAIDSVRDRVIVVMANYSYRDPSGLHGSLRVLGRDGRLQLPRGGQVAVDERTGVVYVAGYEANSTYRTVDADADTLMALDLDANRIIGTVELGRGPHELVIDSQTSRVYVSNGGDSTVSVVQGVRPLEGAPEPVCPSSE